MSGEGSRTRNLGNRATRNTSLPADSSGLGEGASGYYLIPVEDDWRGSIAPPISPSIGQIWIVPLGATGAWAGRDGQLASYTNTGWVFSLGTPGATAYIKNRYSRSQLIDFNAAPLLNIEVSPSDLTNCTAWVPDDLLDCLQGMFSGLISNILTAPPVSPLPYEQNIVGAPAVWPNLPIGGQGDVALAVVDQTTNTLKWVYRNSTVDDSEAGNVGIIGLLAFITSLGKFAYYAGSSITGVLGSHWVVLGQNITLQELYNIATPGPGQQGYSLTWDDVTGEGVWTSVGGAVTVPTKLMQLTGDVLVGDIVGDDGKYLKWVWGGGATKKWEASQIVLGDIGQSGATDGQVPKWDNTAGKWVPATPAGGTVPTKLMQLTGDVNITDAVGEDKQFLRFDWSTQMWIAHSFVLGDIGQSGATVGQVATWNGSAWVPATPAASAPAYAGVTYKFSVGPPSSWTQVWNVGWGTSPRYAVPANVAYILVSGNFSFTVPINTPAGAIQVTLQRCSAAGAPYWGVADVVVVTYPFAATTLIPTLLEFGSNGIMQAVAGDYIVANCTLAWGSWASQAVIQIMRVG